ncbi:hypothetical protein ECG_00112 [Echinococcus granulosus]|uniref:RxLR effector candidate protein n=1 Tax=Echinococcus granulosus TaxID=6210 RepID=A0A068WSE3_ECHGR|nr:hypothetical protein ECG_00112 [Echinococcus granulosus]CDS22721.1 hypothetical protein EgrG_002032800 [Echinococcus granulosus]
MRSHMSLVCLLPIAFASNLVSPAAVPDVEAARKPKADRFGISDPLEGKEVAEAREEEEGRGVVRRSRRSW